MGLLALLAALAPPVAAQDAAATPNELLARRPLTFVVGTGGGEESARALRRQASFLRALLFPDAELLEDDELEPARGRAGWPSHPILFGAAHENLALAALEGRLPFALEPGRLVLGDERLEGDDLRFLGLVPGRADAADTPGHPPFLLYAATGELGIAEINAISHGADPILVADRFGPLLTARWKGGGVVVTRRYPRVEWRVSAAEADERALEIARPVSVPPNAREAAEDEAIRAGARTARERLALAAAVPVRVHLYPDARSKLSLTQRGSDGHADAGSRSVHLLARADMQLDALAALAAHELTHVLTWHGGWSGPGTSLLGEGVAVFAAGSYGGRALDDWARELAGDAPEIAELAAGGFRALPESRAYPLAGLLVEALGLELGLEAVREHLYGATPDRWEAACAAAGRTAAQLERVFAAHLAQAR